MNRLSHPRTILAALLILSSVSTEASAQAYGMPNCADTQALDFTRSRYWEKGKWIEVSVGLHEFEYTRFGNKQNRPELKPDEVISVGFTLAADVDLTEEERFKLKNTSNPLRVLDPDDESRILRAGGWSSMSTVTPNCHDKGRACSCWWWHAGHSNQINSLWGVIDWPVSCVVDLQLLQRMANPKAC